MEKLVPRKWDARKELVIPGTEADTITFCVEHFLALSKKAIADHGAFYVALSGGSTPKALFQKLSAPPYAEICDWKRIHLFWSDERAVPPENPDSNYKMAMDAGLGLMPIPPKQIHRMQAEENIEENALSYEKQIQSTLKKNSFDLIMLGMGEDGHTASLFPQTTGLKETQRLVIANQIPQKNTWRMTMTYRCINSASQAVIYVLGSSKKKTLANVLLTPEDIEKFPIQGVGTPEHPALWILDDSAASDLSLYKSPPMN
ncbi:MAG: 6-phosphogluconolactonase [Verrucomicrobia bacterium]|nr:6-phosphogluconolactonase [Verrucomicrobiota bacterium]